MLYYTQNQSNPSSQRNSHFDISRHSFRISVHPQHTLSCRISLLFPVWSSGCQDKNSWLTSTTVWDSITLAHYLPTFSFYSVGPHYRVTSVVVVYRFRISLDEDGRRIRHLGDTFLYWTLFYWFFIVQSWYKCSLVRIWMNVIQIVPTSYCSIHLV